MHELAITESILNIALSEAEKHGASKVISIKIKLGEYSDIVPQFIQEYFNIVSAETPASGASLFFERIPVTVRCLDCGAESPMEKRKFICPACRSSNIKMLTGKEFYIDSLEAE